MEQENDIFIIDPINREKDIIDKSVEQQTSKVDWKCPYCPENRSGFSSKQALDKHLNKGVCLKKGYLCLRCFELWRTPSELQRHQLAQRKCKKHMSCKIQRDADDSVYTTEKKF